MNKPIFAFPIKVSSRSLFFLVLVLPLLGCAIHSRSLPPDFAQLTPLEKPRVLEPDQLVGLRKPDDMITDPKTGKQAVKPAMEAFWKLREKAAKDGWELVLVSGYRSFEGQRLLWNRYFKRATKDETGDDQKMVKTVMRYTSVPGFSRHHWGTDLDISEKTLRGQLLTPDEEISSRVLDFYHWMEVNAPRFGFCKVYRGKKGIIADEPWHWSFWRLAVAYQHQLETLPSLEKFLRTKGVEGGQYIHGHIGEILQWQALSVDAECSR